MLNPTFNMAPPDMAGGMGGQDPRKQTLGLVDGHGRRVKYLRLSITDRCNFRCHYCLPADGVDFVPKEETLSFEEIATLVRSFVHLGVTHLRVTGGEPLLRRNVVDLVARLSAIDGLEDISMTTNGFKLVDLAAPLKDAGLRRVNISIDTLRPERFRKIARVKGLERVLAGIRQAHRVGLTPLKLNTVVVRGLNDDELIDLVAFARTYDAVIRFIEYMPIGVDGAWSPQKVVSTRSIKERLATSYELGPPITAQGQPIYGAGPAVYHELRPHSGDGVSRVGFISPLGEGFCGSCNRVRLTAVGTLQACLARPGGISLRDVLRSGASEEEIFRAIQQTLWTKTPEHDFRNAQAGAPSQQTMSVTGG